jgi:hypothetical protein
VTPRTARWIDKIVALIAAVLLAGVANDYPSARYSADVRGNYSWVVPVLLAIAGVFTTLQPLESLAERSMVPERLALQQRILSSFGRMLDATKEVRPPLDTADFGLHLWVRKRSLRNPVSGRLVRVATYRLGGSPVTRNFRPTVGVGVVGLCWRDNSPVHRDVEALVAQVPNEEAFAVFSSHYGADSVMGLQWKQFQTVSHRGAVFSSPVRDGRGRFVGCVSADADHGHAKLVANGLQRELDSLASSLGRDAFRKI